ncbi:MAG: signal recognition particle-docking protein FtsY [Spirochaetaceae bacterium]|jgi:fused signal recognition particle receptor|nr:signal recognition particle-docking protein FtsY [Spirochaetaceae bacterium]
MGFGTTLASFFGLHKTLDEAFFDDLADTLVEGDFPALEAFKMADNLRAICRKEGLSDAQAAKTKLAALLREMLDAAQPAPCDAAPGALTVLLLLGVNGVGKTTSAAKLAALYKNETKPLLAAADTFRAAAIDQLKIHGERLGVRVVSGIQGGDSAACIYDAITAARAGGYTPVIADTAGRMHTKSALVDELKKIDRIVLKAAPEACIYKKYLVLDSTTGSNALAQAETFCEAVRPSGVILTKCDSTAKGGIVFPLASRLHLPVLYTCFGESYEDIQRFDSASYTGRFLDI